MPFDSLIRSAQRRPIFLRGENTREVHLERADIERLLPHRPPLLLIDSISAIDLQEQAVIGHRRITPDDPSFTGHFPSKPVYPGVLLVEIMAQLGVALQSIRAVGRIEPHPADQPADVLLLRIHHAVFLAAVKPGDELTVMAKLVEDNGHTIIVAGQILRSDEVCAVSVTEAVLGRS